MFLLVPERPMVYWPAPLGDKIRRLRGSSRTEQDAVGDVFCGIQMQGVMRVVFHY